MKRKKGYKFLIMLFFFLGVMVLFILGISRIEQTTKEKQTQNLEKMIRSCAVQTYALEGRYPESLEEIEKNYQITYDKKKYSVDYSVISSNLMPDITIIELIK